MDIYSHTISVLSSSAFSEIASERQYIEQKTPANQYVIVWLQSDRNVGMFNYVVSTDKNHINGMRSDDFANT